MLQKNTEYDLSVGCFLPSRGDHTVPKTRGCCHLPALPQPPGSGAERDGPGAERSRVPASPAGTCPERPRWCRAAWEGEHQPAEDGPRCQGSAIGLKESRNRCHDYVKIFWDGIFEHSF